MMLTCARCGTERISVNLMRVGDERWCPECVYARDQEILASRRVEREEFTPPTFAPPTWGTVAARREDLGLVVIDGSADETKDVRRRRKKKP